MSDQAVIDPYGIDEIKNMLNFLFVLADQVDKVVQKGSVSLFDAVGFFGAFKAAGPAIEKLKDLVPELKNLTDAEMTELKGFVAANLKVGGPVIDGLIVDGLSLMQDLFDFAQKVKNKAP